MNHNKHSYVLIGLITVGAILFFTGTGSGAGLLFLLWPLACVGMMYFMMRGMGMGGMKHPAEHTHADGVTHSHDDTLTGSSK